MSEQNAETHGKNNENNLYDENDFNGDVRCTDSFDKERATGKDYPFYAEKLKTLPLSNDFMFGQVMQSTKICQLFLESVLERPVGKLQNIQQQFAVKDTLYARGVRLDVYLQDTKVSIYNIEMQSTPQQFLEKRYRYYQSQLDQHTLHPGQHYSELKDIYIIFICNFDYFGCGQAVYRCKMVIENCPTALYQDGVHFYLLNAQHREKQINPALQEFLDTVRDNNWTVDGSKTKLGKMVRNEVMRVREDRKVGEKYMSYAMRLQDRYMEGVQEGERRGIAIGESRGEQRGRIVGRQEGEKHGIAIGEVRGRIAGRQEGQLELLLSLVRLDMLPLAEAAKLAGKSEAEFQKLLTQ